MMAELPFLGATKKVDKSILMNAAISGIQGSYWIVSGNNKIGGPFASKSQGNEVLNKAKMMKDNAMPKVRVTRDNKGIHIFLDRARVPAQFRAKDTGHMPTASGQHRNIPAKSPEALRSMHGAIKTHTDGCDCAACKGKRTGDADRPAIEKRLNLVRADISELKRAIGRATASENTTSSKARLKTLQSEEADLAAQLKKANTEDADGLPPGYEVWYGTGMNEGWTAADPNNKTVPPGDFKTKAEAIAACKAHYKKLTSKTKDTTIKAPPPKVSNTKTSEQARQIAAQLKKSKDCSCGGKTDDGPANDPYGVDKLRKKLEGLKSHWEKIPDKKSDLALSVYADIEKLRNQIAEKTGREPWSIH